MRGVYGNARKRIVHPTELTGSHLNAIHRAAQFGVHIGEAHVEPPTMAQGLWDQLKVGTVLTLSVVAVVTAAKVLSTTGK